MEEDPRSMGTMAERGRRSPAVRRILAAAASAILLGGLLAVPLASTTSADSGSVGHRSSISVTRVGPANGFTPAPAPTGAAARARVAGSLAVGSNEFVNANEKQRPNGPSTPKLPTDPAKVKSSSVTAKNPGFRGFAGLDHFQQRFADNGNQFSTEPPDGAICAGGGREIELVNDAIAVYDRKGALVAGPVGVNQFFAYAPGIDRTTGVFGPFTGDIKCVFDPGTHRWFLSTLNLEQDPKTGDFTGRTSVDWAVSKTSDPTGGYTVFSIDTTNGDGTAPGHPGCPCLGDQPLIGVDAYGFYISTNEFSFFGPEFNGTQLYAISKLGLVRAANGGHVPRASWFDRIPLAENVAYSLQPATPPVNGQFERGHGGTAYFLSALEFNGTFDNRIAVWALTGSSTLGSEHPNPKLQSRVIGSEVYGLPPVAQQAPGDTPLRDALAAGLLGDPIQNALSPLDGGDDRMASATLANGLLWGSLATAVSFRGTDAVQVGAAWFAVRPSWHGDRLRASMVNQGYIAVKGSDVIYPGVSVNAAGSGLIAFTLTGTTRHPSAAYVRLDRGGTGAVHVAAAGVGAQDGFSGYKLAATDPDPRPRWGDYTGTAVDETGHLWFEAEYIGQSCKLTEFAADTTCGGTRSTLANWGTFIGRLNP
jgi:hypothetical protein